MRIANLLTRLRYRLTGNCGWACDWADPYGWVPEEGCPVHVPPVDPLEDIVFLLSKICGQLDSIDRKLEPAQSAKMPPCVIVAEGVSLADFNGWLKKMIDREKQVAKWPNKQDVTDGGE